MSLNNETGLAEALRAYFVEHCPALPVSGNAFSLDGLFEDAESMSLQMNAGTVTRFIDGTRLVLQPFTLFYRGRPDAGNEAKSAMIGSLNAMGSWMEQAMVSGPPNLGDWLTVNKFEQVQTASFAEDESVLLVTYKAGYVLGYETVTQGE